MTRTLSRLAAALAVAGVFAACGGGDDGSSAAVASLDEEAAADTGNDTGDDGGGGGGAGRMSSEEQAEFEDAMLEYAQCMRDHGIDMPDPEFGEDGRVTIDARPRPNAGGGSVGEFEAADEECRPIIEDARPGMELDPEQQAELQDRLVALAECMRERGHDMPDPQVGSDGGVQIRGGGPGLGGQPDEEFMQDMEECRDEIGFEGPGGMTRSDGGEGGGA
jgi:hypothetical protein